MIVKILIGDVRDKLRDLPDESVHCVVTSPPYWGMRCYGVDGQIGLEPRLQEYVETMVGVFQDVWRVLRKDGTLWLNLGDSYSHGGSGPRNSNKWPKQSRNDHQVAHAKRGSGLKPKDLCMMPARVALALQADGWWMRSEIIWHKPNPMPDSCTDRPTTSHEKIYLLAKSGAALFWTHRDSDLTSRVYDRPDPDYRWQHKETCEERSDDPGDPDNWARINLWRGNNYYFDADAVRETSSWGRKNNPDWQHQRAETNARKGAGNRNAKDGGFTKWQPEQGRNIRNVWTVATAPFSGAHFATFPPSLIEPCIKAGCPEGGTVLDPFGGAGTTGLVADRLKRNSILIELNPDYADRAMSRIQTDGGMFTEVSLG